MLRRGAAATRAEDMPTFRSSGLSLANKCQLLFGLAVVLILTAALSVPWIRMQRMVDEGQFEVASQLADGWLSNLFDIETVRGSSDVPSPPGEAVRPPALSIRFVPLGVGSDRAADDAFLAEAAAVLAPGEVSEYTRVERPRSGPVRYRYARALTRRDVESVRHSATLLAGVEAPSQEAAGDAVVGLLLIDRDARAALREIFINRAYIFGSGIMAGLLAFAVFYVITTRIILSPVRVLRETAERVSTGELNIRSDIRTGDEFEELSETFNLMLANLKTSQDQLRQINKSLDLKLNELAASNVFLEQSNRLKSEFLANVSHELRTPLNSILGFAEVIAELDAESAEDSPQVKREKRHRYLSNIITSGRSLLELINDLLDLAKIEAGRLEITVESTSIADVCEGLMTLVRPQAEKKGIELALHVNPVLPTIETDPGRFQQIIFNFLSNAVKFTPRGGRITLAAERGRSAEAGEQVRISVSDTGPGISPEDQQIIFEKFRQVDASHTRRHAGTGLGLAISRELATLLGGSVSVSSEVGRGSTFSLTLPLRLEVDRPQPLMPTA